MCGWICPDSKQNLHISYNPLSSDAIVNNLRTSNVECDVTISRLCAICVWQYDLDFAVKLLKKKALNETNSNLGHDWSTVAMAMSGFQGPESSEMWVRTCENVAERLGKNDPYMKRAFWYLLKCARLPVSAVGHDSKNSMQRYHELLFDPNIAITDRIAFGCTHLPFSDLVNYIKELELRTEGLQSLILTGINYQPKIVKMLTDYLNKTLDYQTVLGLVLLSCDYRLLTCKKVLHWKDRYCALLNNLTFYMERVKFEKRWHSRMNSVLTSFSSRQVPSIAHHKSTKYEVNGSVIHCKFCTRNIISNESSYFCKKNDNKARKDSRNCPHCGNKLPRCCVCSVFLGRKPNQTDLDKWISVCFKCLHASHFNCIYQWFRSHSKCPVSGCVCTCEIINHGNANKFELR